jgi:hypothetical protein
VDGLGIELGPVEGTDLTLAGVDYDDCLDGDGRPNELTARGVRNLATYAEVSPSGRGIKQLCWGTLRKNHGHKDGHPVEAYHSGRYFCLTGHILPGAPCEIADRARELLELEEELWSSWTYTGTGRRDDRELAREALAHLSTSRAAGYGDWLAVGMVLHSVGDDLLPDWETWSRLCPEKYTEGACAAKWATFASGGGLTLGSLIHWAKQDSGWTPSAGGSTKGQGGRADTSTGTTGRSRSPDVIRIFWKQTYGLVFRRGDTPFSAALGRVMRRAELVGGASSPLLQELMKCRDPDDTRESEMVGTFRWWAATAYKDLMDELPSEAEAATIVEPAREEFREHLVNVLGVQITTKRPGRPDAEPERHSIIHWCNNDFGGSARWTQVRSYWVYAKRRADRKLAIALRFELFGPGQLSYRELACYGPGMFRDLTLKYKLGRDCRACGVRAVELASELIDDVLTAPGEVDAEGVS